MPGERRCRTGRTSRARRTRPRDRGRTRLATVGSVGRDLADRADAAVARVRQEVRHHLEALGAPRPAAPHASASTRWSTAATSTHCVNCCSSRRNSATSCHSLAIDVDDRLAVRVDEHACRESARATAAATSSADRARVRLRDLASRGGGVVVGHRRSLVRALSSWTATPSRWLRPGSRRHRVRSSARRCDDLAGAGSGRRG